MSGGAKRTETSVMGPEWLQFGEEAAELRKKLSASVESSDTSSSIAEACFKVYFRYLGVPGALIDVLELSGVMRRVNTLVIRPASVPPSTRYRIKHALSKDRVSELEVENERLKTRVKELSRELARRTHQYDQLKAAYDGRERAASAPERGSVRMSERHEGVVMHADDEEVVVMYQIENEYVEHIYRKEQFIDGRLPQVGDRLAVHVDVTELPKDSSKSGAQQEALSGRGHAEREHRKRAIGPPREF